MTFAGVAVSCAVRAGAWIALSLAVMTPAACTANPTEPVNTRPATHAESGTGSSSTSPADAAKEEAVAAYLGMWRSYAKAAETSDWKSPELAKYAAGTALSTLSQGLYSDHFKGLVSRGRPVNHPVVVSAEPPGSPTKVVIADCGDSTNWTKHRADNGKPADDEPGGPRHIDAIVKKQRDGSWKVSDFGVQEVGSC